MTIMRGNELVPRSSQQQLSSSSRFVVLAPAPPKIPLTLQKEKRRSSTPTKYETMLQTPSEKEGGGSAAVVDTTTTAAPGPRRMPRTGLLELKTFLPSRHGPNEEEEMDGGDCDDDDDDDDAEHANSLKPALPTSEQTSPFNVPSSSSSSRSSLVATTVALCLCMLTHSYLLISVFPYSGYMVVALHPSEDVTTDTAGSYAGWIAASFMAGRASTSYFWGLAADCYGRTTVLYLSLGLSAVCTLGFGLSPTFGSAVTLRFLLGASNGIMPTIKTAVSELATNEQQETTIMSTVVGFWGWGFLLSPALSGALADPIRQYPHAAVWQNTDSLAYRVLSKFPFFLPNLLGAFFCVCELYTHLYYHALYGVGQNVPKPCAGTALKWMEGLIPLTK